MHVKVKVYTEANKEKLEKISEDKFECFLKEKPQNNSANKKLIKLFSEFINVPKNEIKIIKGHRNPNKIILVGKV